MSALIWNKNTNSMPACICNNVYVFLTKYRRIGINTDVGMIGNFCENTD